jgi:hypothetical protein
MSKRESRPHGQPDFFYRRIQGCDAAYLANYDSIFRKKKESEIDKHKPECSVPADEIANSASPTPSEG